MRNILIIILIGAIVVILGLMITDDEENDVEYTIDEARTIAENWMENESPTYVFDGSDLEMTEEEELDENTFEFTFNFQSSSAGFGDREGEMTAQVITPHTTVVAVEEGEIVSAVTDGVYSELRDEMIEDNDSDENVEEREVSVYFMTVEDGQEDIVPVEREVSGEGRIEVLTLEELLSGPTDEEKDQGYSSAINEGVEILDFSIQEGTAQVDFSSELDENVAGSATVLAIRGQIENTLRQFDPIDDVVIMVEGEEEGVLQP